MKHFNYEKLNKLKKIEKFFYIFTFLKFFLFPFAILIRFFQKKKIKFLISDGFLIGDIVMARAICKTIFLKYPNSIYLSNSKSKLILEDIGIEVLEYQYPWANYDYSIKGILNLFKTFLKIFLIQPEYTIELRGDFRSIYFLYFTCSKLIGFSFTGGKKLLYKEIIAEEFLHQEEHYPLIAKEFELEYKEEYFRREKKVSNKTKKIGISFSGSQALKVLPKEIGLYVLEILSKKNMKLVYFDFKEEPFLKQIEIEKKFNLYILNTFSFEEYFTEIEKIDYYIGMDSAGGHIASMFQIPSLIFYGTNESKFFYPKGNEKLILMETDLNLSCRPCSGANCQNEIHQNCLVSISKEKLILGIEKLLSYE